MDHRSWTEIAGNGGLLLFGAIPVGLATAILTRVATGTVPADHPRLAAAALPFVAHALGGIVSGFLGPLQFAARHRAMAPHLGLSGPWLLAIYPAAATWPVQSGRLFMRLALLNCLPLAVISARPGDITAHHA